MEKSEMILQNLGCISPPLGSLTTLSHLVTKLANGSHDPPDVPLFDTYRFDQSDGDRIFLYLVSHLKPESCPYSSRGRMLSTRHVQSHRKSTKSSGYAHANQNFGALQFEFGDGSRKVPDSPPLLKFQAPFPVGPRMESPLCDS